MTGNERVNDSVEYRSEAKTNLDEYYSVQFFINGKGPGYLFKLRNISSNGLCILVKQDSSVFKKLNVGDILDMEYNQPGSFGAGILLKTRITSKIPHDRYTGHSIVELSVIDN
jgi:hypothetical protein